MRIQTGALVAVCLASTLAACEKKAEVAPSRLASADAAAASAPAADASGPAPSKAAARAAPPQTVAQLAYRYAYSIKAPGKAIRMLVDKHGQACVAAGPAVCQVTGSNVRQQGKDQLAASLSLRAQPDWMMRFRSGLATDVEAVDGKVTGNNTDTEDLSRQMVDTEAAVRTQKLLRDRMENLLAQHPAKLNDLVVLQQQIAEVQGQIDASTSELAMMKGRVAMSDITLTYQSKGMLAPDGAFTPLGQALQSVLSLMVATLAFLIQAVAILFPIGAVVGGLVWIGTRRRPLPRRTPSPAAD